MLRLTLFVFCLGTVIADEPPFEPIFQWTSIEYNLPSENSSQDVNIQKEYIAENNAIAGIKLWKNKIYLTIPRWKSGVPVTLAVTSAIPINSTAPPMLDPYPNWEMQALGDCTAFQFVRSMEIDPLGRMWVLDTGRTDTMTVKPVTKCPPRLVILDLENNGKVLRSYEFPNNVSPKASAYLKDIVLDHEDGGMAFITDEGTDDPGIIVYSLKNDESWKIRHNLTKVQADVITTTTNGTNTFKLFYVSSIALAPPGPNRLLYYSPTSSFHMYSIPVSVLKNSSLVSVENYVTDLGEKASQSDGMIMTNKGVLYFGTLIDDSIAMWDSMSDSSIDSTSTIFSNPKIAQWPGTFAIDEDGRLWCVANSFQNFINNRVDESRPNYSVLRSYTKLKNYQYLPNGEAPNLPVITAPMNAASKRISFAYSTCLIIVLAFFAR